MNIPTSDWKSCVENGDVATLKCIPIVLQNVVNFLVMFSAVVAVFFIVWSGIKFVTSQGDQQKIESARKTMTWAIAGLVFILASFFIINFIAQFTGVQSIAPKP